MSGIRIVDLREPVETPADGIVSRTIHDDANVRVVLFSFAAGQQLSDHTASVPVTIVIVDGDAELVIGGERHDGHAGSWVHIDAQVPHSVMARTSVTMVLTLLKAGGRR
jgi:quercetin dioxygenase-like cupin family protein